VFTLKDCNNDKLQNFVKSQGQIEVRNKLGNYLYLLKEGILLLLYFKFIVNPC
jgi:hypothetical protein